MKNICQTEKETYLLEFQNSEKYPKGSNTLFRLLRVNIVLKGAISELLKDKNSVTFGLLSSLFEDDDDKDLTQQNPFP